MFRRKQETPRRRPASSTTVGSQEQSRRANVFSYRASRSAATSNVGRGKQRQTGVDESTPPTKRLKPSLKSRTRRLSKIALAVLFVGIVGYNLMLSGGKPEVVVLNSGTYRNVAVYEQAAARAFESSVFNSNKVTVNVGKIEDQLKAEFPELAGVSVRLPAVGHQPTVFLEPSTSRLIVRTAEQQAFIIDETGRAVATGDAVSRFAEAGLPEVQDQSQHVARLGEVVLPGATVSYITEVARQLRAKNMTIESMTLPDKASELHVRIPGEGYYMRFNTRGDARVAVGSFLALKSHLDGQNKKPAEYVDVRIENRTFYK